MEEHFWDFFDTWERAEEAWDERAKEAASGVLLDIPKISPSIPQITRQTARFLPLKGLSWVVRHDSQKKLLRFFYRKPVTYFFRFLRSIVRGASFTKEGDFFYYGIQNLDDMRALMQKEDTLLLVGFSYCEKPFECPAVRFSDSCTADEASLVCQQCFIGKVRHALPTTRTLFAIAPTINAIGEEVVKAIEAFPNKKIIFIIASCEMALTMFGDLGNMVGIQGIGVRLAGRICNTMDAFALSERGIKPGMTWLRNENEKKMLELVRFWREVVENGVVSNED